jgi:type VI secretion system protein
VARRTGFGARLGRHFRAAGAIAALALAAGCGGGVKTRAYSIVVSPQANANSPVPVEMVVVYNRKMLAEVAGLTARDWFERRAQFGRDYPDGWRSMRWEFVPGQSMPLHRLELSRRHARALFIWADYAGEGPHRVRLDPFKRAIVEFGEKDFSARKVK